MLRRFLPFLFSLLGVIGLSAQRQVPRIDIDLAEGLTIHDLQAQKKTWRRAQIRITAAGIGQDITDSAKVRGRGNTTWKMAKKPFRFKFDKKQSPFGLTKGKSWVLLANFLSDAQLNNAVAMKAAQLAGARFANHMIPVELYVNGEYRGLYNLSEQVGLGANSVKVDDESKAALLEWDTYDGDTRRDPYYKLPVDLKDPDLKDYSKEHGTDAAQRYETRLNDEIQRLTQAVSAGHYDELIDIPSLAAFYFVFDLTGNLELRHPKSVNVWRADIFDPQSKWVFGPVWDFDWAYGYEHTGRFATVDPKFDLLEVDGPEGAGRKFFKQLMSASPEVRKTYAALTRKFVDEGGLDELLAYIDDYTALIDAAARRDYARWQRGRADYAPLAARLKSWISARAHYIAAHPTAIAAPPRTAAAPSARLRTLDGRILPASTPRPAGVYLLGGRKLRMPAR